MTIETVTIVPGTETAACDGITQPTRCLVRFSDQNIRAAFVKRLTPEGVAAEAFCALLLRGWGLTAPQPAIVEGPQLAFASLDAGYPNLKQRLGWSDSLPEAVKVVFVRHGCRLVASFADTPKALTADEAIDNRDRNFGNILWDGNNVAWIDHERAFGLVTQHDRNKLVDMVVSTGDHTKIEQAAVAISLMLGEEAIHRAKEECGALDVAYFAAFVASRLNRLTNKVLDRFPKPADLLAHC